jgi:hypothetical protein
MGSFVKWQARLVEAIKDNNEEIIEYCKKIFPKDEEGKPGALYKETVAKARVELENKKPKTTKKTARKTPNTKPRSRKKNEPIKQDN